MLMRTNQNSCCCHAMPNQQWQDSICTNLKVLVIKHQVVQVSLLVLLA
jgi:hypothetical protein